MPLKKGNCMIAQRMCLQVYPSSYTIHLVHQYISVKRWPGSYAYRNLVVCSVAITNKGVDM